MNIATLPPNPYENEESETIIQTVDNPKLNVVVYTEKSFVVYGEATKTYKNDLRNLGGKYNGKLKPREGLFEGGPGWIYFKNSWDKVIKFVNQINTRSETVSNDSGELPTVVAPVRNSTFQWVKWKVFRPAEGMKVTVKVNGSSLEGNILQTETHHNWVDTAYVDIGGKTSKLVICNGAWQVWGYMVDHTVFFSNDSEQPRERKEKDYSDIANI